MGYLISGYQSVYRKPYDNLYWLVAIPYDNNHLEIHQTDEHGVIIIRDTYESNDNTISCLNVERLQEDGKRMVDFQRIKSKRGGQIR